MKGPDRTPEAEARLEEIARLMPGESSTETSRDVVAALRRIEELGAEVRRTQHALEIVSDQLTWEKKTREQAQAEVERLKGQLEDLYSEDGCPKCGCGVSAQCYGCLWKQAEARLARVVEALRQYLDVLDNAPEESSTTDLRVLAAQDTSWFKGKANSELVAKVAAAQDVSPEPKA